MTTNKFFALAVSALVAGWLAGTPVFAQAPGQGQSTGEQEPNDPIGSAQSLDAALQAAGSVSVTGALNSSCTVDSLCLPGPGDEGDLDFYSFKGSQGDVVTIDIDNGWGGQQEVNTVIALFGPGPLYPMFVLNDDNDNPFPDSGSTSLLDPLIRNFELPVSGLYTVGVSNFPRVFRDGGTVLNPRYNLNGDYTLVLTKATNVLQVSIDIKPGNEANVINPKSKGKIPVAILSTADFAAPAEVDTASLTFGRTGDERSLAFCRQAKDVNDDGLVDLVCHFKTQSAGFQMDDVDGYLKGKTKSAQITKSGQTKNGQNMEGSHTITVVPAK